MFGFSGCMSGCDTIAVYSHARTDASSAPVLRAIESAEDKAAVALQFDRLQEVVDHAKERVFPFAVADLVLGIAIVFLTMRAMAGRKSARGLLLQVLLVHVASDIALFILTPDVRAAWVEYFVAAFRALSRTSSQEAAVSDAALGALRATPAVVLVVRGVATALVLLSLSTTRARAFFEGTPAFEDG
jgi:hypothetical protein